MNWQELYNKKLTTADEAVKIIKDGDDVEYTPFACGPHELDAALARRKDELKKIYLHYSTLMYVPEVFKVDPLSEVFVHSDGSYSAVTRKMKESGGNIYAKPLLYHETGLHYSKGLIKDDVYFLTAAPMDKFGFFNLGPNCSDMMEIFRAKGGKNKNLKIIVEVNPLMPVVQGDNSIHITDVDLIVEEQEPHPLVAIPAVNGDETDEKIARLLMNEMVDGACLQLGIGGLPNMVGKMLAESDFKNFGCHSEMFVDAYMELFNAGKLTNARKQIDVGKSVFTFGLGSKELYEFMNNNPSLRCMPVGYTNDPNVIAQNDRVYSICSCINVDLFGNISSESVGYKQISGTGGQLDYHFASLKSNGGKGFLCMHSSKVKRDGTRVSNIVPYFEPGTQISIPANMTNYVVTEYGIANMKGLTTWERVEELIRIAHPDFKQDIADAAEKAGLWKRSNKL